MFLNINILKRLMKQAYRAGLYVATTQERYYIAGSYWEMDIKKEFIPKQILAQLIELTGEIPGIGEKFQATKDGNQYEMGSRTEVSTEGFEKNIQVTNLILLGGGVPQRILQDIASGNTYIVNNVFVLIADNSALDEDKGEYRVEECQFNLTKGILWQNNVARLHAMWRDDKNHDRLLAELTGVDLTEDVPE